MKKIIFVFFLLFSMGYSFVSVADEEVNQDYTQEFFDEKFEQVFPEYKELFQTPSKSRTAKSFNVIPNEVTTITREDGNDVYCLTLYDDESYSRFAVAGGNVSFSGGSSSSSAGMVNWTNRVAMGNFNTNHTQGGFLVDISYSYYTNGLEGWFTGYGGYSSISTINNSCSVLLYRRYEVGGPARLVIAGYGDYKVLPIWSDVPACISISIENGVISGRCDLQSILSNGGYLD